MKPLSLAVVLQLVPFIYMFASLVKFAATRIRAPRPIWTCDAALGGSQPGCSPRFSGIALVFFPAQQITSLWSYELWMFGGTLFFIGLAAFFLLVYGRNKAPQKFRVVTAATPDRESETRR